MKIRYDHLLLLVLTVGGLLLVAFGCQQSAPAIVVTRVVTSVAQEIVVEPTTVVVKEVTATPEPTAVPTETPSPTPTMTPTPTATPTPNLPQITDFVELAGHEGLVNSIQFSPDSQLILAASDDSTARLWDLAGNLLVTFAGHTDRVTDAIFSPDGSLIVTSSDDKTARIWSLNGELLHILDGHLSQVLSALFTPDGRFIITNALEPKIWDIEGNLLATLEGHRSRRVESWISPKGNYLLTSSDDSSVFLWEIQPDGRAILLTDLSESIPVGTILRFATFFPNNQGFILNSLRLQLWGITPESKAILLGELPSGFDIRDIYYTEDKIIFLVISGGVVLIRDVDDPLNPIELRGHEAEVITALFYEDANYVLTGSADHTARLWNLNGEAILQVSGHDASIQFALLSGDQIFVVTGDESGIVRLWDVSSSP